MMKARGISFVLICLAVAGCSADKKEKESAQEQPAFSTSDFTFRLQPKWSVLEDKSSSDRVVFEAPDWDAHVTVSVGHLETNVSDEMLRESFVAFVEDRRSEELDAMPTGSLTDPNIIQQEGIYYARYAGADPENVHVTATFIALNKGKLFTIFIERNGYDANVLNDLASLVIANFTIKKDSGS